ncbi:hypothetical protein MAPG_10531 [Magnaporthiopsis poae ATCC 64411]|uniref:Clr5 domain-containing protein n=1 Tax=Magnaporthiopsis poae (strain ATCC 64411 / 73-15) TaxID=644358 RepID=A0A0C4ECU6_MAGP6|nr:hypothetical protein MAPG_10531 [Magnaporthiopsis poae ATCC 64411]
MFVEIHIVAAIPSKMAAAEKALDWPRVEREILKYFVQENHTLEETQTYMATNFGFNASIRQYKRRYGGHKNLKTHEWAVVFRQFQRRARQGMSSELWIGGRKMDPRKVSQQFERYRAQFAQYDDAATPPLHPRLEVRTPPSTTMAAVSTPPPASSAPNTIGASPSGPEASFHVAHEASLHPLGTTREDGGMYNDPNELLALTPNLDFGFLDFDALNTTVSERIKLLDDLPWFQLQDILVEQRLVNHRPPSSPSVLPSSSALAEVSVADRQALLAGLLGSRCREPGASPTAVPTLTTMLSETLPEYFDGETSSAIHGFLDPANKYPLQDTFKFACYFFSNNMLTREQRLAFMRWVMGKNYTQKLADFLGTPSTGVDGFRHGVIAAIMDMGDLRLVILLVQSGVCFDDILAQATGVSDQKFFDSLIQYGLDQNVFRQLSGRAGTPLLQRAMHSADEQLIVRLLNVSESPGLLSGPAGGELLRLVVEKGYLEASKTLILRGCALNTFPAHGEQSTQLGLAVWLGHTQVVKCLVEAGVSLSTVSTHRGRVGQHGCAGQPLALAVRQAHTEIITILVEAGAGLDCSIYGLDIFRWSSVHNAAVYRHLCAVTGREGTLKKAEVTAAEIARAADRGPGPFTVFHMEHRANLTDQILQEALQLAVERRMVDATSTLLSAGVDPDCPKTRIRIRPLVYALVPELMSEPSDEYEDEEERIVELLLDAGANPNDESVAGALQGSIGAVPFDLFLSAGLDVEKYGPRLLVAAVASRAITVMVVLLEKGVSPNSYCQPRTGKTALQEAAGCGHIDYIDYLLQHGGDINMPASRFEGRTALQAASESQKKLAVEYLLEKGADVNAPPAVNGGLTALEASLCKREICKRENTELFELLLERGALINQPRGRGASILRRLIDRGTHDKNLLRLVSLALDAGADPNEVSTDGCAQWAWYAFSRTALQLAAETGSLDLVKLIVSQNGDVNRPAWRHGGRTALQAAVSRPEPQIELVQYLLNQGADVNATPAASRGLTALQGASIKGHAKVVLLLLQHGADPNARPALEHGRTALQGAAEHGRLDVVKLLLNAGARPHRWDGQRCYQTEIDLAEKNKHFTIAELLRSHEQKLREAV